jgi:hypothetical protein
MPAVQRRRRERQLDEEVLKSAGLLNLQALRLLRAFFRIDDPQRRQEIIQRAEDLVSSAAPQAHDEADH